MKRRIWNVHSTLNYMNKIPDRRFYVLEVMLQHFVMLSDLLLISAINSWTRMNMNLECFVNCADPVLIIFIISK